MSKQVTLMTDAIPYQEFAKLIGKSTGAVRRMIDTRRISARVIFISPERRTGALCRKFRSLSL